MTTEAAFRERYAYLASYAAEVAVAGVVRAVDELRERMREELDYSIEAGNLAEFESRFQGHPWVRIPKLVPELSSSRVLTTEWIDGMTFDQFRATESYATKQRAAEGALIRNAPFHGIGFSGAYQVIAFLFIVAIFDHGHVVANAEHLLERLLACEHVRFLEGFDVGVKQADDAKAPVRDIVIGILAHQHHTPV